MSKPTAPISATIPTALPRNVNKWRAAAILYGDWGTSKAYVLGLAFSLAGYSSFWFIASVSILTMLVGLNYILICKLYPYGGGVYASVRSRSQVLSLVAAFFLISDYLVTAALSALSALHYLGVDNPEYWAMFSIAIIGLLNFLGPKHTGSLALTLAIPTVLLIITLGALSLPFLPRAIDQLTPIHTNPWHNWNVFVGIIVALSGIEAIANITGSMPLDPGSDNKNPAIGKTSTPAIVMVMVEVAFFTALLGLAMNALPGLEISGEDVNAPDFPHVRDAMLRYMGDVFASAIFSPMVGHILSIVVSIIICLLLLSAVNTAMVALISLLYVMSRDGELPAIFARLNSFGVPIVPVLIAFLLPMIITGVISDIAGLANLYAIGFVGAIAVNLGATATNFSLPLAPLKRCFMLGTCLIMSLIEITLFIDKPQARIFVLTIVTVGLLLRTLVAEQKQKQKLTIEKPQPQHLPSLHQLEAGLLVAITGLGKALDFALEEAFNHRVPLYILFVREQSVVAAADKKRTWRDDPQACQVYDYVVNQPQQVGHLEFLYAVSAHTAYDIANIAKSKRVQRVVIERKRKSTSFMHILHGTTVPNLSRKMPKTMDLLVIY